MNSFSLLRHTGGATHYRDRDDAGERLAHSLRHHHRHHEQLIVAGLTRGGVVIGRHVAEELHAPLIAMLVKKIGHPFDPEYAIGAVVEGRAPLVMSRHHPDLSEAWLRHVTQEATATIAARRRLYGPSVSELSGKTVIVVDDGMATGYTMLAAVDAARAGGAARVIVAVPVASQSAVDVVDAVADEVITLDDPDDFLGSVGAHYISFSQVDDADVRQILAEEAEGALKKH